MIPLVSLLLPTANDKLFKPDGTAFEQMRTWMRVIFNRTGNGNGVPFEVDPDLTATGASQATALQLNKDYNIVLGGPGAGVILHDNLQPAQTQWVWNRSGGNINVYPPVGAQIDALGPNNPIVVLNGTLDLFLCATPTQFYSA